MHITNQLKNQHLLWRAGFGPGSVDAGKLAKLSQKKLFGMLVKDSAAQPEHINVATGLFPGMENAPATPGSIPVLTPEQKKAIQQKSREDIKRLNLRWMNGMVTSEAQFREKMSLFWHGHFACRVFNVLHQQQLLNTIREDAFGKFGNLLRAVSKSPAMLQFLNNQQNRKQHPNENFARELLELFTLGRGNYNEQDVKEAARAFTGWGFSLQAAFVFRDKQHDDGKKTFLGKSGNFDGDDIIDILLEQKQTAVFIAGKVYHYFVNEIADDKKVAWLADRFFNSGYAIQQLMEDIFTSDWFYEEKNIGNKIKSPVELLVGIQRLLPLQFSNEEVLLTFQRSLGQVLFYPPNVAGWPGGRNWIDSSTLMLRLRIAKLITAREFEPVRPKNDDDIMMGQAKEENSGMRSKSNYGNRASAANVNWAPALSMFEQVKRENLLQAIANSMLQTGGVADGNILAKFIDVSSRESYTMSAIVCLMSTPEYQLC